MISINQYLYIHCYSIAQCWSTVLLLVSRHAFSWTLQVYFSGASLFYWGWLMVKVAGLLHYLCRYLFLNHMHYTQGYLMDWREYKLDKASQDPQHQNLQRWLLNLLLKQIKNYTQTPTPTYTDGSTQVKTVHGIIFYRIASAEMKGGMKRYVDCWHPNFSYFQVFQHALLFLEL